MLRSVLQYVFLVCVLTFTYATILASREECSAASSALPVLHLYPEVSRVKAGMPVVQMRSILGQPWGSKPVLDGATALYFDGEDSEGVDRVVEVLVEKDRVLAVSFLR